MPSNVAQLLSLPSEVGRVAGLPERPPIDCDRDRFRRWSPEAQSLVNDITEKYRVSRLSCGCRDRQLIGLPGGRLLVFSSASPGETPSPPLEVTIESFIKDTAHQPDLIDRVSRIQPNEEIKINGLGHLFCMRELNPVQAWVIRELAEVGGIFGMVSVGGGKTAAGILAPLAMPIRNWAILVKPDQRLHYLQAYLRIREHFRVPSILFERANIGVSGFLVPVIGTPVLHVIPYSLLSRPDSTKLLDSLDPDGIIADESHLLSSRTAARTMRVMRYLARRQAENRPVTFACWSGSTVKKSLRDTCHLAAHALGLGSPYPIPTDDVDAWAAVIDPSTMPDSTSTTAAALRQAFCPNARRTVLQVAGILQDDSIREGHRDKVVKTPGVVSTRSSSIACSITIRERKAPPIPASVMEALKGVRGLGPEGEAVRPDGDVLVERVEQARVAREVASGFYNYWKFRAEDPEELIDDWFAKRKSFYRDVRQKILGAEAHMDSVKLLENAAERAFQEPAYTGDLPVWPIDSWPPWAKIRDLVPHWERVRWIDDFLARDAAAWAAEYKGVVWCHSRAFGQKVAEIAGLPYHGGGPNAEAEILAEDGSRSVIASIRAHGTGRDGLQSKFSRQLVAEVPSSGDGWEQLLGRLAREGQTEDTVTTEVYRHVPELREALRKAVSFAEFIEATTPNRQSLLAADIEFDL